MLRYILIFVLINQFGRFMIGKQIERFCLSPCSHPIIKRLHFRKQIVSKIILSSRFLGKRELYVWESALAKENRLCPKSYRENPFAWSNWKLAKSQWVGEWVNWFDGKRKLDTSWQKVCAAKQQAPPKAISQLWPLPVQLYSAIYNLHFTVYFVYFTTIGISISQLCQSSTSFIVWQKWVSNSHENQCTIG